MRKILDWKRSRKRILQNLYCVSVSVDGGGGGAITNMELLILNK
jgi:hypothetical protein